MNYYLCPTQDSTITVKKFYPLNEMLTIDYPADIILPFKRDEHVFILQGIEESLLPYEFSIANINRSARTLVLRVITIYQNPLPMAALAILLPDAMVHNYVQFTSQQFKAITSLMNIISSTNPAPVSSPEKPQEVSVQGLDDIAAILQDSQKNAVKTQDLVVQGIDDFVRMIKQSSEQLTFTTQESQKNTAKTQDVLMRGIDELRRTAQATNAQLAGTVQDSRYDFVKTRDVLVRGIDELGSILQTTNGFLASAMQGVNAILKERTVEDEQEAEEEPEDVVVDGPEVPEEIFAEADVLDYVKDYIRQRGYYFKDETLYNYHICLKTRPFVILAGLSGTGKSKLAQLYAEALGQDGTFKRLPVRPNWNDDRYLLGHLNTVTGEYITEPALDFILAARAHPKKLYSLCLDEMNIAHVEYYFSQFLSAMEGDSARDRRISLMSERTHKLYHKKAWLPPIEINLPDNLIFTGTINVDETTQPISDKVIDRANTIEFFNVDLSTIPEPGNPGDPLPISNRAWQSYRATKADTRYRPQIIAINNILQKSDMGLGYRVVHEIELYLANSKGLLDPQVAFDLQCKQRILPRIRGTEIIGDTLGELITFSKTNKLAHTERRLQEMKNRLNRDGYTSFWR